MNSQWKKINKHNGNIKRACKRRYQQILASNNPEVACSNFNGNRPAVDTHERTDNNSSTSMDIQIQEFGDSSFDNVNNDTTSSDDDEENNTKLLSESEKKIEIRKRLITWATSYNITHSALRELFSIWNEAIPNFLPKDPRTILRTPKSIVLVSLENGSYWHNGLISELTEALNSLENIANMESISLNFNIDGLPIHKSSRCEFWPILCSIHEIPEVKPLVIGIYCGTGKPPLKSYLENFVNEAKQLQNEGIVVKSSFGTQAIGVKIRCFICDSPARAFIKGIANFNAKNGCNKCTVVGEYSYLSHTVYFPKNGCTLRTDEGFRNRIYGSHHKMDTPLEELHVNMIEDFPVGDSLHLIDLGLMKRCLMGWKDGNFGNYSTKWRASDITLVSTFLLKCKMPTEIHRAVRGLDVLAHWKGTEYRTFLLYIGIVVLKKVLSKDVYQHFLLLFCAVTICSSNTYKKFLPLAESLLDTYVEMYRDFYGEDYMTSNVHNLTHLVSEVRKFGVLATFNAYPFENRLFFIKNLLRNGKSPLAQVAKRLGEGLCVDKYETNPINNHYPILKDSDVNGRSAALHYKHFLLNSKKDKDKWFLTTKNEVVCMQYAIKNDTLKIYGYPLAATENFFGEPIRSSYLNIFKSKGAFNDIKSYTINDIKCKLVLILEDNVHIFIPLLHSIYEK